MYLKKILLSGFKSFADRIVMTFDRQHITGVIGPNGSGKSNVIDAVRWVMGEQNAKMLRGEKATDIIFSGSEKRKALGMAEVSLVFDNTEASSHCPPEYRFDEEIILTRKLYSDGQREFLINKKPCRLKDIVGFFVASGLGGRSYSMIQQGQVERILQAKPEELREIVEEAAGTVIFKKKLQETERKLTLTQENLNRLDDILKEIQSRKDELKDQAEKAEKWEKYSKDLKGKELEYFVQSFLSFKFKQKSFEEKAELKEKDLYDFEKQVNSFEVEMSSLQTQLCEADPELAILTERISRVRESLAVNETHLLNAIDILENGEQKLKDLEQNLEEDQVNLSKFEEQNKNLVIEYEKAKELSENAEEIIAEYDQQLEAVEENILVQKSRFEDSSKELTKLEKLIDNNKFRHENLIQEVQNYRREKDEFTQNLMSLENEYSQALIYTDSAQVKLNHFQKNIDRTKLLQKEKEQSKIKLEEKISSIYELLEKNKIKYLELSSKIDLLNDSIHWTQEICHVFAEKLSEQEKNEIFILSECLSYTDHVKDLKISAPIKKAIEIWIERVVVSDASSLQKLESLIAETKASHVPVTLCENSHLDFVAFENWIKKHDLQTACDVFTYDSKHQKNLPPVLKRIAFSFQKKSLSLEDIPCGMVYIDSDGNIYSNATDFVIPNSKNDTLLAVEEKKKDYTSKQKDLQLKIEEQKKTLAQSKDEFKQVQNNIEDLTNTLHDQNKEQLELLGNLQSHQQKANHKQEMIIELRKNYTKLVEKNEDHDNELQELEQNQILFSEEKRTIKDSVLECKEQIEANEETRDEIRRQKEQLRFDLVSAETKLKTFQTSIEQSDLQLNFLQNKTQQLKREFTDYQKKILSSKESKKEYEDNLCDLNEEKTKLDALFTHKKNENSSLTEEIKKCENKIKKVRQNISQIKEEINNCRVEKEKIEISLTNLCEQANEKSFEDISLEAKKHEKKPDFNAKRVQSSISQLKNRIESLGPINMMAINEFKKLSERFDFIDSQRTEILSSMDLLELAIEEISDNSKNKFMEAFNTLNVEFKELFPILFPNGEGHITLTSPDNPLNSGLEIIVRLPGKSQKNMRLFSGGEKALTAIALIFALLKSKPTPFCFLDEVDAALDETNVGRYNKVLDALSDRFQFIVITHRRKTMEVLDTLYGVTMQEPGVSKVVGVDLSKSLPAHLQKAFKTTQNPSHLPTPKTKASQIKL